MKLRACVKVSRDGRIEWRKHALHVLPNEAFSKMKNSNHETLCPICGGRRHLGATTYSVDLGTGVIVVRNVQAHICSQCGEEWIDHLLIA